jgi:TRAP transporter TAXI family solute receptor
MLKKLSLILTVLVMMTSQPVFGQTKKLGIVTGSSTGTYVKIGKDISKLLERKKIGLDVHTSAGSLENIYSVFKLPKAQMGIVQSDVLAFISTRKDEGLGKIAPKIRLLHPLYNEEVHILATNDVSSFSDLEGKKVAIGKKGSGTFLTAKTLLQIGGVDVEGVNLSGADALKALKSGDIDAMIYVAGFPVKLFAEKISEDDKLQLLPIQNKEISEVYNTSSTIPSSAYPWLGEDTPTVAVKAVLITYAYKRSNCQRVGRVANIIAENIDWLRENGHPKWDEVDLDFKLNGWTQYECVLGKGKQKNSSSDYDSFLKAVSDQ